MCFTKRENLTLEGMITNAFFKEDAGISFWDNIPKATDGVE